MFKRIIDFMRARPKENPIVAEAIKKPVALKKPKKLKGVCSRKRHNCLAHQLANRLISVVLELEITMKSINDMDLPEAKKKNVYSHFSKTLITALWALSPAFDLIVDYKRVKAFKLTYGKALRVGSPGILEDIKHI